MNKVTRILCAVFCAMYFAPSAHAYQIATGGGAAAPSGNQIQIRRADAVQEQQQEKGMAAMGGNQLLGTAIGLVAGAMAMRQEVTALKAGCQPSGAEIEFVNNLVKSWAAMGRQSAKQMLNQLGNENNDCSEASGFAQWLEWGRHREKNEPKCFDLFKASGDTDRIWAGYPMASNSSACVKDGPNCKKEPFSTAYDVFGAMSWTEADILPGEASGFAKMMERTQDCSPASLERKRRETGAAFVTGTISSLTNPQQNQQVNTMESVMGLVGGLGSGNTATALQLGGALLPAMIGNR